jgi:methionine--tRNA ligase beta chain
MDPSSGGGIHVSLATMKDFEKLDLRVVKVISAERIPGMKKLLRAKVDVGGETREMILGGGDTYSPEYFAGKLTVAIVNLEPKSIAGVESRGMLLAADLGGRPVWLTVDREVPPGTKVR